MTETEVEIKSNESEHEHWCDRGFHHYREEEPNVNWREFLMMRDYEKELAEKDHRLNLSDAERISDKHDIELYKQVRSEIKAVEDKLEAEVRRIDAVNCAQNTYNATNSTLIAGLQREIDELMHMSRRVIPNCSVNPGWGDVSINPTPWFRGDKNT